MGGAKVLDIPEGMTAEILVVNPRALLPGDVILSTAAGFDSWVIRTAISSNFSHAALHVGHGVAIEANDPGVVQVFLPVIGHDAATLLAVRRMPDLTIEQRNALVQHALDLLYRPYSTVGAVGTICSFLRKASDPGRFCSQLVAHCYSLINRPICPGKPPEAVTPEDIAASGTLTTVQDGVRRMSAVVHTAVTSLYAQKYASYLQVMSRFERALIEKAETVMPRTISEKCFNIFDVVRQVTDATLPEEIRNQCDELVGNLIEDVILGAPLRPCPGLSVATFLFMPPPVPTVFTKEWEIISAPEGKQAFRESLENTYLASKWELARWREEAERLAEVAERTGLDSTFALAAWMEHAAETRLMYAALCASSTGGKRLAADEKNEIRTKLRAMIEKDPIGAQEFNVDSFMALQQEVIHDSGEPGAE